MRSRVEKYSFFYPNMVKLVKWLGRLTSFYYLCPKIKGYGL